MPTYVYKCQKCEVELELIQKISDEPIRTCPECGTETLKRVIHPSRFLLKGKGWYRRAHES